MGGPHTTCEGCMGRDGRTTLHVKGGEGMGEPCYTHVRGGRGWEEWLVQCM